MQSTFQRPSLNIWPRCHGLNLYISLMLPVLFFSSSVTQPKKIQMDTSTIPVSASEIANWFQSRLIGMVLRWKVQTEQYR